MNKDIVDSEDVIVKEDIVGSEDVIAKEDIVNSEDLITKVHMENSDYLKSLVKNNNFLNHQNYVLSPHLYQKIRHWMSSSSQWKNIIWFDPHNDIQEIPFDIVNDKTLYSMIWWNLFWIVFFLVWYFISTADNLFVWSVFILLSIVFLYALNSNWMDRYYLIYRNKEMIIINKKNYYRV